jgi:primosomal protein N' (replication factor Y)
MLVPVLLPKIFNYPLTYSSNNKNISLKTGDFVEVPFGKTKEIGVIWDKLHVTTKKIKIKKIKKKIKNVSLNTSLIRFINWFSIYNFAPKGLVLKMCMGDKKNLIKDEKIIFSEQNLKKKNYILNDEQKKALKSLNKSNNKFKVSVLQGVTGSGKTIVYFERVKKFLDSGNQVLILLPEIFLTNQFRKRFEDFFGFKPFVWHSKITPKNKRLIWQGVLKRKINLVIGARSSLALPFKNLGLIIVDEEHDPSYKQEEGIIYNARDMAVARGSIENIPVDLITSVPSLETFKNIENKKYDIIKMNKRFENFPFPETKVINLNYKKIGKMNISEDTINEVKTFLNKGEQVLFFLNRRGYAPLLICKNCGFKHLCPNCSIYLTYHKRDQNLICHHCGNKKKVKNKCLKNETCDFVMYGPGVEKIYDELKIIFPGKNIKIFSSDYLTKKKNYEKIFYDLENNKIDIIVGTQMISKGFNFPKLNCIVVVDADFSGKGYDLRATEKNIQLYNQLSGRAGRFSSNSLIIYQTVTPLHKTLNDIIINNPEKFLIEELETRRNNNLPPFKKLIAFVVSSYDKDFSFIGAKEIKKKLSEIGNLEILGPVEAPIQKIKKKFRTRLLLRSTSDKFDHRLLAKFLNNLKISSKIKLTVDVDPINFS